MNDILTSMEYGPAPEDASEVRQWLKDHKNKFGHFIGGKFTFPKDAETIETSDPATGEKLADVAKGTKG